jgi:hypothetical protein
MLKVVGLEVELRQKCGPLGGSMVDVAVNWWDRLAQLAVILVFSM